MSRRQEEVRRLLEPTVEAMGYELADLELRLGRGNGLLRLFIDSEAGIGLDDCEQVSRQVSAVLDVEDPIPGNYNLEVSSPGLDRRLAKPEHFDRFAGCDVTVRLRLPLEGRRKFRGSLLRRDGDAVVVECDGTEFVLPMDGIEMARLVPDLNSV
ncbi:MAG: ribosome maturation factor RimP [Gammaproteobacteria bacterium]|nr:ribosome maturation factor RimP [Gammaproteobacteria bacterium]